MNREAGRRARPKYSTTRLTLAGLIAFSGCADSTGSAADDTATPFGGSPESSFEGDEESTQTDDSTAQPYDAGSATEGARDSSVGTDSGQTPSDAGQTQTDSGAGTAPQEALTIWAHDFDNDALGPGTGTQPGNMIPGHTMSAAASHGFMGDSNHDGVHLYGPASLSKTIDTTDHTSIRVAYTLDVKSEVGVCELSARVGSGAWTELETITGPYSAVDAQRMVSLPGSMENQSPVEIRWSQLSATPGYCQLDDIEITAGGEGPAGGGMAGGAFVNLQYASGTRNRLDLTTPAGAGPFPTLIWIHGGGWQQGTKDGTIPAGMQAQLSRGYALAAINYTFSSQQLWPQQVEDVKAAIRFLRANAEMYRLDEDHFATWGCSAGGHLSVMAALTCDDAALEDLSLGNAEESSCVQAAVDWSGNTDFSDPALPANYHERFDFDYNLIGCDQPNAPNAQPCPQEAIDAANPATYVDSADSTPLYILHGQNDTIVPPSQSQLLVDALVSAGVEHTFVLDPSLGHCPSGFNAPQYIGPIQQFLDLHLGGGP